MTAVSVVIPALDAESTLGEQLAALVDQDWRPGDEVIVADNGSRDATVAVAGSFRGRLPDLTVADASARRGTQYAMNTGAAAARNPLLLFCDADDVVASGWVAAMRAALSCAELVGGRFEFASLNDGSRWGVLPSHQQDGPQPGLGEVRIPHVGSGNLAVRRELYRRLGGIREDVTSLFDTEFCWRAHDAGVPVAFAPDAVVHVRLRGSARAAFRQGRSYGRAEEVLRAMRAAPRRRSAAAHHAVRVLVLTWLGLARDAVGAVRSGHLHALVWHAGWRVGRAQGLLQRRYPPAQPPPVPAAPRLAESA